MNKIPKNCFVCRKEMKEFCYKVFGKPADYVCSKECNYRYYGIKGESKKEIKPCEK
jgi:hypothetical protein